MNGFLIGTGAVSFAALSTYLYAVFPRKNKKFKLPYGKGYAHRGLWNENAPENSLSAFRNAVEKGYGIELDVHLTADKRLVVFHDDTLLRMCGDGRRIDDCTYDELSNMRLLDTDERMPSFSELLELVDGKVPLLIELKGSAHIYDTELCDVIAPVLDRYEGDFVIESFNPLLLARMKKIRPDFVRGQLVTSFRRRGVKLGRAHNFLLSSMLTNCVSRPDFIAYDLEYPRSVSLFVTTKILGAKRCVWTPRKETLYREFIKKGDCPIFDSFVPEGDNENA